MAPKKNDDKAIELAQRDDERFVVMEGELSTMKEQMGELMKMMASGFEKLALRKVDPTGEKDRRVGGPITPDLISNPADALKPTVYQGEGSGNRIKADENVDNEDDIEDDVKDNDTAFSNEGMDINIEAENETEEGEGAESALDEYAETSSRKRMRILKHNQAGELNSTRNVLGVAGLKCFIWNKDYSLLKTKLLHQESLSMSKHRQMSRDKTRTIRLALCNPQD
uniref:Uncharacterized protein n=1 Tax=Brassica oleracea var. oleracea TaxID=109376 RepID=A0A0D3AJS9_BRAOL